MAIGFSNIPADIRVPLFYAEMDNSAANSASSVMRRLIVGQVNDDATAEEVGQLVLVPSVSMAKSIGGQVEGGAATTLTVEQFQELLAYMQALRDWPQSGAFPDSAQRPVAPPWIAEQSQ